MKRLFVSKRDIEIKKEAVAIICRVFAIKFS